MAQVPRVDQSTSEPPNATFIRGVMYAFLLSVERAPAVFARSALCPRFEVMEKEGGSDGFKVHF